MKKILKAVLFIMSLPLIGSLLVKPDKILRTTVEKTESALNTSFRVTVHEDRGDFHYCPEEVVELMVAAQLPEDISFREGEAYVETASQSAYDLEQEYLKALAIVMRTNLVNVWEHEGCPESLDFDSTGLCVKRLRADLSEEYIKKNEIERAVEFTCGAVITKEKKVIPAPFFTSSESSMLIAEAGDGEGFSLNYAYFLAKDGLDFYEILKYFYDGISVEIYE